MLLLPQKSLTGKAKFDATEFVFDCFAHLPDRELPL